MGEKVVKVSVCFIIFKLKVLFELDADSLDRVVSNGDCVCRVVACIQPPKNADARAVALSSWNVGDTRRNTRGTVPQGNNLLLDNILYYGILKRL